MYQSLLPVPPSLITSPLFFCTPELPECHALQFIYPSHISPYLCLFVHFQVVCKEVQRLPAGDWTFGADNACARPGVPPWLLHLL